VAAAARAFGFLRSLISGYNVANSLRFNTASSDYLNRTFGVSPTSRTELLEFTILSIRDIISRISSFFAISINDSRFFIC
jgi:hypothetical protein